MIELHIIWICAGVLFAFIGGCVLGFISGAEQDKKLEKLTYQHVCKAFKRKE
jgi:hypothetical protein